MNCKAPAKRRALLDISRRARLEDAVMNSGRGVVMVVLAAMLWGTTGTAQSLAPAGLSPYAVGAWRLLLASVFFAAVAARSDRRALALRGHAGAVVIAGTAMAGYNLAFFAGVRETGVAIGTAVALGSGPIWAGLLQVLFAGRRPSAVWWLGTALAVAGGALLVLGGGAAIDVTPLGVASCALAGLSYAVYALVSKRLVGAAAPEIVTLWVFGVAAVIAIPLAAMAARRLHAAWLPGGAQLLMVVYLGVVTCGVAYLLFNHALRSVSGPTAVTLALAEPVVAFTLAVAVLGEQPAAAAFGGLALVLAGLLVVVRSELRAT
jgi:drug/metabolite transporter, DME family